MTEEPMFILPAKRATIILTKRGRKSLLNRRINWRAELHKQYRTKLIATTVGMVINALLYGMNDRADQLLIRK